MKKNIIKIALLSLFFFAINSCKDTNTEKVKNSLPNPEDVVAPDCSWCGNTTKENRYEVYLVNLDGKMKFSYTQGLPFDTIGELNPFDDQPYGGLSFCCLKCLNEFSSSKLVNTKFELVNNDGLKKRVRPNQDPLEAYAKDPLEGLDKEKDSNKDGSINGGNK